MPVAAVFPVMAEMALPIFQFGVSPLAAVSSQVHCATLVAVVVVANFLEQQAAAV
jgi:hypothetical protein